MDLTARAVAVLLLASTRRADLALALATALLVVPAATAHGAASAAREAQMILHLLDYVAVDYAEAVKDGAVVSREEYAEQVEFVGRARAGLDRLEARPGKDALVAGADRLVGLVRDRRPPDEVAAAARRLRQALVEAYDVEVSPRRPPDLRAAATLYAARCATCHGPEGRADGPAARALSPAPASFHDRDRMAQRSVHGLYNAISLGVAGTAMTAFEDLSDADRWGLAFHAASLGAPAADVARGAELWKGGVARGRFLDLRALTTPTEREVREQAGEDAVRVLAYLRTRTDAVGEDPLALAARLVRESAVAYREGRARAAQDLAVSAYLDGVELVEPALDVVDPGLRVALEGEMLAYRNLIQAGGPAGPVNDRARAILARLDAVRARLAAGGLSPLAGYAGALVILLREGFEAILIVAAMVALLVKAGRRDALAYVHAGWLAALALGAVTWLVASYVVSVSGARREVSEGVTALAAAAILLYVGYWMHGNAYAAHWRAFLDRRLGGAALSGRTAWALAAVSFLAVYREAFETVLLAEALWMQAGASGRPAALAGFATAAVALVGLGWLIVRGSLRLPLGPFFGAASVLLAVLAVALAGKGVAALQEAGMLPVSPLHVPSMPLVGLYPSLQGVALQAALLLVIALGFLHANRTARRA